MDTRGRQPVEDGPTHGQVAANVRELRESRRQSQADLSARLADVGRPIGVSALSKIEQGNRRVTVDDLVALALALDVNPNALLLPAVPPGDVTPLTSAVAAPWWRVWQWATGEAPLDVPESQAVRVSDLAGWFESTKPHKDSGEITEEIATAQRVRRERRESLVEEVHQAQDRWREHEGGE